VPRSLETALTNTHTPRRLIEDLQLAHYGQQLNSQLLISDLNSLNVQVLSTLSLTTKLRSHYSLHSLLQLASTLQQLQLQPEASTPSTFNTFNPHSTHFNPSTFNPSTFNLQQPSTILQQLQHFKIKTNTATLQQLQQRFKTFNISTNFNTSTTSTTSTAFNPPFNHFN